MIGKLEKSVRRLFCIVFVAVVLADVAACLGDSPEPRLRSYNVEIQGAKIISEGGYLWFHVVNHEPDRVSVAIYSPLGVITVGDAPSNVSLEATQTADFYFQVPYYWSRTTSYPQQNSTQELKFYFAVYGPYHTPDIGTRIVEFDVKVVPLNGGADDQYLFYLTILIMAVFILTAVAVIAELSRQEKKIDTFN
jgi:hypothetical protein